jgi:uncharacterized protein YehS (DUF1456 family)
MINLTKEDLLNLLKKSFEEGYSGFLDVKEEVVHNILDEYLKNKDNEQDSYSTTTQKYYNNITLTTSRFF